MRKKFLILLIFLILLCVLLIYVSKEDFHGTVILMREVNNSDESAIRAHEITQCIFNLSDRNMIESSSLFYEVAPYFKDNKFLGCHFDMYTKEYSVHIVECKDNTLYTKEVVYRSEEKIYNPVIYNNYLFFIIEGCDDKKLMKYDMHTDTVNEVFGLNSNRFGILDGKIIFNEISGGNSCIFTYDIDSGKRKCFRQGSIYSSVDYANKKVVSYRLNEIYVMDFYSSDEQVINLEDDIIIRECVLDIDKKVAIVHFTNSKAIFKTRIYSLENMSSRDLIKKKHNVYVKSIVYLD